MIELLMTKPHKKHEPLIVPYERAIQDYSYDPETGIFINRKTDKRADGIGSTGYRMLYFRVDGKKMQLRAHRVAWLMTYGEFPKDGLVIDHINRDPQDNRLANLRAVSMRENQWNRTPVKPGKLRGIRLHRGKSWEVSIGTYAKSTYVGSFKCLGHAIKAHKEAAIRHFGQIANG